jgi:hypothetical protein
MTKPTKKPAPRRPRCPRCGGQIEYCDGPYCPTCQTFDSVPGKPARGTPPSYVARTAGGAYVREGADLADLIAWLGRVMNDRGDVVVSDGARIVAVVYGDTGQVVKLR